MEKEEIITEGGITYKAKIDSSKDEITFFLEPKSSTPEYLYKYYRLDKNSIDAIVNGYLFASHPYNFNDEYDCSPDLIDYSDRNLEFFLDVLGKSLDKDTISEYFSSEKDKWRIVRKATEVASGRLWLRFGVISLTTDLTSMHMWAHYAENSGFVVKFNTAKLNKKYRYGPFPVSYRKDLPKIKIPVGEKVALLLYQSTIKSQSWEIEKEWRYLTFNQKENYHPYFLEKNYRSRFETYNKEAIQEIILGYHFFDPISTSRTIDKDIVKLNRKVLNHKLKRRLLNLIVTRKIPVARVSRRNDTFLLEIHPIHITKISCNKFEIVDIE
ncbi:MAG: DUF2971 domain-containing protein [Prevotellaceae bacterium]|jgi:hypothetical protein|nr:DUF2971 domain-containing protein [Prevotellaceae bacterium]